jgi:hypothetical protein
MEYFSFYPPGFEMFACHQGKNTFRTEPGPGETLKLFAKANKKQIKSLMRKLQNLKLTLSTCSFAKILSSLLL